jgi:hypothetical protein
MSRSHTFLLSILLIAALLTPWAATAMGLRSFVALPVEKGGTVMRFQLLSNNDTKTDTFISNMAYGINHRQTLLLGLPYRLSPSGSNRTGDLSALYRYIAWQDDQVNSTQRLGLLGGVVLPTDNKRHAACQAGAVYTYYAGRNEWDLDYLYQAGNGNRVDRARYDISWQHRLSPTVYPEWGTPDAEWDSVLELNGRWQQGVGTTRQITIGLQRITQQWVLEAGLIKDLNKAKDNSLLLSMRFHF